MKHASCLAKVAPSGFAKGRGKIKGEGKKKISHPLLLFQLRPGPPSPTHGRGSPGENRPPHFPCTPCLPRPRSSSAKTICVSQCPQPATFALPRSHTHTDYRHRRTYMAMEELLPCLLNSMQSMHLHLYNVCVYFPPLQWKLQWDQASRVHISFYLFICGSACENPAWKKKIYPMQACLPASLSLSLLSPNTSRLSDALERILRPR